MGHVFLGSKSEARKSEWRQQHLLHIQIYLTINGETNDLVGLGSCVLSNAYRDIPAKLLCSASTIKGSFAGEFVIRHIGSDTSPDNQSSTQVPTAIESIPPNYRSQHSPRSLQSALCAVLQSIGRGSHSAAQDGRTLWDVVIGWRQRLRVVASDQHHPAEDRATHSTQQY